MVFATDTEGLGRSDAPSFLIPDARGQDVSQKGGREEGS